MLNRHRTLSLACLGLLVLGLASAQEAATPAQQPAKRAYLGVMVEPAKEADRGVIIRDVTTNSPAAKAGLKAGDRVTKVGDRAIKDIEDFMGAVLRHKPGDKMAFQVEREGKEQSVSVTLGEPPVARPAGGEERADRSSGFLGVQTARNTPETRERFNVTAEQGAIVTDVLPDSPAAKAGLKRGDVITKVGTKAVTGPEELREAVRQLGAGKEATLTVQRGQETTEVKARLEEAPVDGIGFPPLGLPPGAGLGGRPIMPPIFEAGERVRELERRLSELEKRVRELEQKRGPEKK